MMVYELHIFVPYNMVFSVTSHFQTLLDGIPQIIGDDFIIFVAKEKIISGIVRILAYSKITNIFRVTPIYIGYDSKIVFIRII